METEPSSIRPAEEPIPEREDNSNTVVTLFRPDEEFHGYRIIRHLNTDAEGIKYIVCRGNNPQQYVLRIFHKSYFENIEHLFMLQKQLSKLKKLRHKYIAEVVEADQNHDPAYIVAKWETGKSLAELKNTQPGVFSEEFVRKIGAQLIEAALAVRQQGLTINKLTLVGVLLDENNDIRILSSGITYDEADEREDIFTIGVMLSQLLCNGPLYASIYNDARLRVNKFHHVSGTSIPLNKVLADALHRNIIQRYTDLPGMLRAWQTLPPVADCEIHTSTDMVVGEDPVDEAPKPRTGLDFKFWLLTLGVIAGLIIIFTTNIFSVIFGDENLRYEGLFAAEDSLRQDTRRRPQTQIIIPDTLRLGSRQNRVIRDLPASRREPETSFLNRSKPQTQTQQKAPGFQKMPDNFVPIRISSFGFGRGKGERPNVTIDGFYISKFELTQSEWRQFMTPANCSTIGDELPVDNISFNDIIIYCNARSDREGLSRAYSYRNVNGKSMVVCDFKSNGYRLPTEAEWELAAKSGQDFDYSGSDTPEDVSWFSGNSTGKIRKPGLKRPNAWGLYDMTGNVAEWCWDWFDPAYVKNLPTFINPTGPETGTARSIRGGSVMNGAGSGLNILSRDRLGPATGKQFLGFRLVRTR